MKKRRNFLDFILKSSYKIIELRKPLLFNWGIFVNFKWKKSQFLFWTWLFRIWPRWYYYQGRRNNKNRYVKVTYNHLKIYIGNAKKVIRKVKYNNKKSTIFINKVKVQIIIGNHRNAYQRKCWKSKKQVVKIYGNLS